MVSREEFGSERERSRDESAVVDAMMGDGDDVPPESKLLEQCVEDMDEKVKREMLSSPSPTENGDEGFPETAEEKLQRVIFRENCL